MPPAASTSTRGTLSITGTDSASNTLKMQTLGGTINVPNASTNFTITTGISGAGGLTKSGDGTLTFTAANTYSGVTTLNGGAIVLRGPTLAAVTALVRAGFNKGGWNGTGIISTTASSNPTRLTALGVIVNDNGSGTPLYGAGGTLSTTFNGGDVPIDGDILVKYTYYGDANLDGKVDGSDYSRIDNGLLTHATGWYNGDFNYDNAINGSDYALIDNAFNRQAALINMQLAGPSAIATEQIVGAATTSAVPEPALLAWITMTGAGLLIGKRR